MLRLVYHTTVFGPLHFEFSKPLVRIGSCRDNDLVLPHSSIKPYHCILLFQEEAIQLLPPEAVQDGELVATASNASSYGAGDVLNVGEVALSVETSDQSVALPDAEARGHVIAPGKTAEGYWRAGSELAPVQARWLCPQCGIRLIDAQLHVMGLVGHRRHLLCPQCSHEVVPAVSDEAPSKGLILWLTKCWRCVKRWLRHTFTARRRYGRWR